MWYLSVNYCSFRLSNYPPYTADVSIQFWFRLLCFCENGSKTNQQDGHKDEKHLVCLHTYAVISRKLTGVDSDRLSHSYVRLNFPHVLCLGICIILP